MINRGPHGPRPEDRRGAPTREPPRVEIPTEADLKAIIEGGDAERLVHWAERVGRPLGRQLKTSQIRNIFGTVRRIENDWARDPALAQRELVLLKPKMSYYAHRETGGGVASLEQVLRPAIDLVKGDERRFRYFVDFFEAILAYHRAEGGRD